MSSEEILRRQRCFVLGTTILKGSSLIELCASPDVPQDSCSFGNKCIFHPERAGKPEDWVGNGDRKINWREGFSGRRIIR